MRWQDEELKVLQLILLELREFRKMYDVNAYSGKRRTLIKEGD